MNLGLDNKKMIGIILGILALITGRCQEKSRSFEVRSEFDFTDRSS